MQSAKNDMISKDQVLNVVFTFNRPAYLRNFVNSHLVHTPDISLLIIDDASDDHAQLSYLKSIQKKERIEVLYAEGRAHRHGGLYTNMNRAIDVAYAKGYCFINLLQDDMQLVRNATNDMIHACNILNNEERALQISMAFRKYLDVKTEPRTCEVPDVYLSQTLHAADTGILHIPRAKSLEFRFQSSEREHSARAQSLGLINYVYRDPAVAWVPWPIYYRNRKSKHPRGGALLARKDHFRAIRTMSEEEVERLKSRNIDRLPYLEDWCRPDKGCWIAPYNYTNSLYDWSRRIGRSIVQKGVTRRSVPRLIRHDTPISCPG